MDDTASSEMFFISMHAPSGERRLPFSFGPPDPILANLNIRYSIYSPPPYISSILIIFLLLIIGMPKTTHKHGSVFRFGFVFEENSTRSSRCYRFQKAPFSKYFPSARKRNSCGVKNVLISRKAPFFSLCPIIQSKCSVSKLVN